MKKVRMMIRCIAWPCFIIGLALLISWAILERWPGFDIPLIGNMAIENVFYLGIGVGFTGLIVALIVEDNSAWESICKWLKNKEQ